MNQFWKTSRKQNKKNSEKSNSHLKLKKGVLLRSCFPQWGAGKMTFKMSERYTINPNLIPHLSIWSRIVYILLLINQYTFQISLTCLWTQKPAWNSKSSCQFCTLTTISFVHTHSISMMLFLLKLYDQRLKLQYQSFLLRVQQNSFHILLMKIPSFDLDGSLLLFTDILIVYVTFFSVQIGCYFFVHFPVAQASNLVGLSKQCSWDHCDAFE